jgi:hypothetical protein
MALSKEARLAKQRKLENETSPTPLGLCWHAGRAGILRDSSERRGVEGHAREAGPEFRRGDGGPESAVPHGSRYQARPPLS